ncbi:MAG: response regulator [Endomicrobia bacterium]|nr:response regulator [Endomicrobiia bacterium]MCL2145129.1 response regulator [Endomicrobiia bacterium]
MAKILIIDDEPFLREMLNDILNLAGYDVITAVNGKDGLNKIFSESPDIVLLDCSMPEMDGYEVLTQLRKEPKFMNLPVIMLTAISGESEEIKGFSLGLDDYITKPFKSAVLLARVRTILERKKLSVDANPLTSLAGNAAIKAEAEKRLQLGKQFALLYIDISNFKSYNDKYGFQRGDDVIKFTADCLLSAIKTDCNEEDFVGHIGGDDFVMITSTKKAETFARKFIDKFDAGITGFYDENDKRNGYIMSVDRQFNKINFPIMTVSVAIISTETSNLTHFADISKRAAELKAVAKRNEKSSYVFERRK